MVSSWTRHAEKHYRRADGTPTGELANYRDSLKPLRRLYGPSLAVEFSPLKLKDLRKAMIESGLSRTTINQRIGRIVRLFKWAASEELVPARIFDALKTVSGLLQKGRTEARESSPVRGVPGEAVEAIRPHVARQVWAMVELQRLTGMRPGEVVIMRTSDLDTSGEVWLYTPTDHKTAHHGRERTIYLGPRAQEVLLSWLRPDPLEYRPPQQNLWVRFGSGSCPRLCNKASFATFAVRNPYDFLVTSFTLLFRPSTAPDDIAPRARNQFRINGR